MALTGKEILYVQGVDGNGQPAAQLAPTTTQAIANLADQTGGAGLTFGGIATASYSVSSSATLQNVTGLVATVVPGGTYIIDAYLSTTDNATGGLKVGFNGGTASASTFIADTWVYNNTTVTAQSNTMLITNPVINAAVTATAVQISGTIVISSSATAGGTIQMQAAQAVSNGTPLTIANGSYLQLTRLS